MSGFLSRWWGKGDGAAPDRGPATLPGTSAEASAAPAAPAAPVAAATPAASAPARARPSRASAAFVRREAVISRNQRIAGFEFSLGQLAKEAPALPDDALLEELALAAGEDGALGARLAFIPVALPALSSPHLSRLPPENVVLMLGLPRNLLHLPDFVPAALARLRDQGFRLGMYVPPAREVMAACRPCLDFIAIDVTAFDGERLRNMAYGLKTVDDHPLEIIAWGLGTVEEFSLCFQRGFDYFQGPAVSLRESWKPGKGAASRMRVVQLLNQVRNNAEIMELAETLKQDPLLSFRILRYINSPGIGLSTPVASIKHALVVLGRDRFYRWLSLLLFTPQEDNFGEWLMVESALTRGRLMELLGQSRFPEEQRDHLFLAGSFSLLDKLLQLPMDKVVAQLTLPPTVAALLLRREGPLAPWLALVEACEGRDGEAMEQAARAVGCDPGKTNRALLAAMAWAHQGGDVGAE